MSGAGAGENYGEASGDGIARDDDSPAEGWAVASWRRRSEGPTVGFLESANGTLCPHDRGARPLPERRDVRHRARGARRWDAVAREVAKCQRGARVDACLVVVDGWFCVRSHVSSLPRAWIRASACGNFRAWFTLVGLRRR